MSTADIAITRDIVSAKSLRGKRVDVAGTAFQVVLLGSLLVLMAALVILIATVLGDGLSVFQERGFVIGDVPASFGDTLSTLWDFLANPSSPP